MSLLNLHDYVRLALSHAVFVPNDDGSWTVEITVLPGCVTWGKTRAEAALMAEDAAEGWLLTALQFGDEIPVIDGFALNQVLTTGTQETTMVYESKLGAGGDLMLREASAYFAGAGALRSSLRRLAERLEQEGIAYVLLGGLALGEHGYPRMTEDIDVLLTPVGLQLFRERCVGRGYRPAFNGAQKTFRDTETGVRIEFRIAHRQAFEKVTAIQGHCFLELGAVALEGCQINLIQPRLKLLHIHIVATALDDSHVAARDVETRADELAEIG